MDMWVKWFGVAVAVLLLVRPVAAQPIDFSFESLEGCCYPAGWVDRGNAFSVTSFGPITAPVGSRMGRIDNFGAQSSLGGSIRQYFDTLTSPFTFQLNFITSELPSNIGSPDPDYWEVDTDLGIVATRNALNSTFLPSDAWFGGTRQWAQTGWFEVTVPEGASWVLLSVNNWSDTALSSHLLVDEVPAPATPIPEPETYAMLSFGLALLAWARRRKLLPAG